MALHLNLIESHLSMDALCQVWMKLAQWLLRRFLNIFNIILHFCYYLSLEKGVAFQLNKIESPLPKDILCHVRMKLAKRLWRRRFLNFFNRNLLFRYYLPLEKSVALHLNKYEFPSSKDALCQVWLKRLRGSEEENF